MRNVRNLCALCITVLWALGLTPIAEAAQLSYLSMQRTLGTWASAWNTYGESQSDSDPVNSNDFTPPWIESHSHTEVYLAIADGVAAISSEVGSTGIDVWVELAANAAAHRVGEEGSYYYGGGEAASSFSLEISFIVNPSVVNPWVFEGLYDGNMFVELYGDDGFSFSSGSGDRWEESIDLVPGVTYTLEAYSVENCHVFVDGINGESQDSWIPQLWMTLTPEPATVVLLGLGACFLAHRRGYTGHARCERATEPGA